MSSPSIGVASNVTLYKFNRNGEMLRKSDFHNKANRNIVTGLLNFLRGYYNETAYSSAAVPSHYAQMYIPTEVRFGNAGVSFDDNSDTISEYDSPSKPNFADSRLTRPLSYFDPDFAYSVDPLVFESKNIGVFDDINNSLGLSLYLYIPEGTLVYRDFYDKESKKIDRQYFMNSNLKMKNSGWVCATSDEGRNKAVITELGLYSCTGVLLAKVSLTGALKKDDLTNPTPSNPSNPLNPLIIKEDEIVVIEWKISIISIGDEDPVSTSTSADTVEFNYVTTSPLSTNEEENT